MTIQIVRPDHRVASPIRSVYNSVLRNINPLAVDAYAIVIVLGVPIGIINALRVRPVTAGPFAAMQARVPTVQLRALMIVGASVTKCRNRQNDDEQNRLQIHADRHEVLQPRSAYSPISENRQQALSYRRLVRTMRPSRISKNRCLCYPDQVSLLHCFCSMGLEHRRFLLRNFISSSWLNPLATQHSPGYPMQGTSVLKGCLMMEQVKLDVRPRTNA
jgi:hypothetical protein